MPSLAIRYGTGSRWIEVPSKRILGVMCYRPTAPPPRRAAPVVEQALEMPVDGPPLADAIPAGARVCVVVPERARGALSDVVVPVVLSALDAGGVGPERREVLVARSLRRASTEAELDALLGTGTRGRARVTEVDPGDGGEFRPWSGASPPADSRFHRALVEADFVLVTGAVGFHPLLGYDGGMTTVALGCTSVVTADGLWLASYDPASADARSKRVAAGVREENPFHRMAEGAAVLSGKPAFAVNAVLTPDGRLLDVLAGAPDAAYAEACRLVAEHFAPPCEKKAALGMAVAGGHPKDVDFLAAWQALENAAPAVEDGGVIVLHAECAEGWGGAAVREVLGISDAAEAVAHVAKRFSPPARIGLAARALARRFRIVLVSSLPPDEVRAAGMEPAADPEAAAAIVGRWLSPDPPTYILPEAGYVVPVPV